MTIIGRSVRRLEPNAQDIRVFGEPYEAADGSTIITVTRGGGGPFTAGPMGIFVVHDGKVTWEAALDKTRLGLFAEFVGLAATVIVTLTLLRRPPWPDVSAAGMRAMRGLKTAWS
ncbi:hypothetical protein ACQPW1_23055 [Nocardia sp. CA-128927]|uniref:hypothetical protein n=1 Tax=Nocardia sp. CA-128927 TaxID=3239975 RepID=UPI003D961627